MVKNKPQYDRFDSTMNTFTENGAFSNSGLSFPTIWDDNTGLIWWGARQKHN